MARAVDPVVARVVTRAPVLVPVAGKTRVMTACMDDMVQNGPTGDRDCPAPTRL